jgi:ParB/RepB/Spo0J family partition protein
MAERTNFPAEIQLIRNKGFQITNEDTRKQLEEKWGEAFLWSLRAIYSHKMFTSCNHNVHLFANGENPPTPILHRYRNTAVIDLQRGLAVPAREAFHSLFGLEDLGDGLDEIRQDEARALVAIALGYLEIELEGDKPKNPKKHRDWKSPNQAAKSYIKMRQTRNFFQVLNLGAPTPKPDLHLIAKLEEIEIPYSLIRPDAAKVEELANEIRAHGGLIHPVTVIWLGENRYRLVAGRRRYAAYKLLGWTSIPVRIIAGDEPHLISTQIIENDGRLDMDPFTRADAYSRLKLAIEARDGQCSNKGLAAELGVTPQMVSEVLKIKELPETFRDQVRELGLGHRATVDLVRDVTKTANPEDVQNRVAAQKAKPTKVEAEDSNIKAPKARLRGKTIKYEKDGNKLIIKSPHAEGMSNEDLVEWFEAIIKKLKEGG